MASMTSIALWPAKSALRLGERAGGVAGHALARPARRTLLASLDSALSAGDSALRSTLAREAASRVLASPLAEDVLQRVALQVLDSPEFRRSLAEAIDSPTFDELTARALGSPEAERLVGLVIGSRLVDVAVERLLVSDALWLLINEVAQSPTVTAAISRQGMGFADQIAGAARERSRTADDRVERLAARLTRRLAKGNTGPGGESVP